MSERTWITDDEWEYLCAYVRKLLPLMRLSDWTITLEGKALTLEDDCFAKVWLVEGRRRARIEFREDWNDRTPEQKAGMVIHELCHCHQSAVLDIIRLDLPNQLSQSTYDVLFAGFKRQIEFMTDAYTETLVPLLPAYEYKAEDVTT